MTPDLAKLTQFGIRLDDEGVHPAAPDEPNWNESVFYDWVAGPDLAGHVRIGRMPNQGRVWLWVFLWMDGEWLALEQPHLPISLFGEGFDCETRGLLVRRTVTNPLRENRLRVAGMGRVLSGARTGMLLPFDVDLRYEARGPAHSLGEQTMAGHSADSYSSNRYEQPCQVTGTQRIGDRTRPVEGGGERDHSWGPRMWNMEWYFLAAHRADLRIQTARIIFDEDAYVSMGYVDTHETKNVVDTDFQLTFHDDEPRRPYEGTLELTTEDDAKIAGRIETITGCPIDVSHCFDPPQPSRYARALIRFHPQDGSAPLHGWLEINRFPGGISEVGFP